MEIAQQPLPLLDGGVRARRFVVARNPDPESSLPYLLSVPAGRDLVLKAREPWPVSSRVYCHRADTGLPLDAEVLDEVPVRMCAWRGSAIDLVLDRYRHNRSQFVFTRVRGRPAIFWQTPLVARSARPRIRLPVERRGRPDLVIEVDAREQRPYRFAGRPVHIVRSTLFAGDYAIRSADGVTVAVERKTVDDLIKSLTSGSLAFAAADLSALTSAAIVVEGRYSSLFAGSRAQPGRALDQIARLSVRYPNAPLVFAETRKLAEDWTYRFLAAAAAEFRT